MTNPVQVNRESLLSLAKDVISYQSDRDNEGALAQYLADRLRNNGLQVHDEDVVAGRPNVIVRNASIDTFMYWRCNGRLLKEERSTLG